MSDNLTSFSDDFFVNIDLHTALPLPQNRETVLQFCETVQKQTPSMGDFYQRESGEYVLEGDRNAGSYAWMEMAAKCLSAGCFNPATAEDAYKQHAWLLDRSRYYLGISPLDVESLDLVYGFNFDYVGNRDAIVCDALFGGSRLAALVNEDAMALSFEPSVVVGLNAECSLQARLAVETRNSSYQVRTGVYDEEPISVYFAVRAYPSPEHRFDLAKSLARQIELGEDMAERIVIPKIIQPIASAIAAAQ